MKRLTLGLLVVAALLPATVSAQRIQQKLGRAVVAVTDNARQEVLVTWRKLAQEPEKCTYNLYKRTQGAADYTKVNAEPITTTNYQTTRSVVPYGTELAVTVVAGGVESEKSNPFLFRQQAYKDVFFDFDFETTVLNPNDYKCKYAWPMDLDGNGEIDAVLADRLYAGSEGLSHKLQAYLLDGTCLWTIDMGPNVDICAGQNDMVTVYDINCDGRCEVIIRSSDATRFWDATAGTWGLYANGSTTADTDGDGIVNYRKQTKRNPPYYVSVVDGRTGREIDCSELKYEEVQDGSDQYSRDNRSDYYDDAEGTEYAFLSSKFVVCYFDGIHPSLAVEAYNRRKSDGHHYYMLSWEYDWVGGRPSNWHHNYTWSRNGKTPHAAEFHQLRVADTDGDGIDEMLEGGFGVNPVKGMVYSAGIAHGDRFDVADIDPERPGMEVFAIQQSALLGQVLYDARTGEHIKEWYLPSVYDVARGRCIDVDPDHKGYEIFSMIPNLYDCKGNIIKEGETAYPHEALWWDGDLQREMLGSPGGSGYGTNTMMVKYDGTRLIEFSKQSNWAVHSGWANRPAFMGDITGDWREEVILMKQNAETSTGLVGYSTDIPTQYSIYTLMEDQHYRLDCTGRGYYQMPCTSFYLGGDMPYPPLPPTMTADLRWTGGAAWTQGGQGFTTFDQTAAQPYADGKTVIFDISGRNDAIIDLGGVLRPKAVYVMSPLGHDYQFGGSGQLAGDMTLYKSMEGTAMFSCDLNHTGGTEISEGSLVVNGTIAGPVSLRAKGTLGGNVTVNGPITFEGALNYEGCRLRPAGTDGVMTFGRDLVLPGNVYIEVDAADGRCGRLSVKGNLTFEGENIFTVRQTDIAEGDYVLAECTGELTADAAKFKTRGLTGVNYTIRVEQQRVVLSVSATRAPAKNVVWTGGENGVWDYKTDNFAIAGEPTVFVTGDEVVFNDDASVRTVTVNDDVVAGGVTFDVTDGTYTVTGEGGISGSCGVTKNGSGEVRMNLKNSDYTGPTVINGGTLTVTNLFDGGQRSAIGASSAAEGNLRINGGTLKLEADNMATDRIVTLADTATIIVANASGSLSLKGQVKGEGYLVKDGPGQLNFTYGGTNSFAGVIVRRGIIAQGEWNATFGRVGSPMELAGGEVHLINMNNSSTRPIFNYVATAKEGTSSFIKGTTRGAINGSFRGKGNITILSSGVRNDIGADFSAFEGQLTAQGENFRLMDNVTNMSKTAVVMDAGCKMSHYASNGSQTRAITTRIGSLASTAKDCVLGNGVDSYEVGHNGTDATYAGLLKAKTVSKYGDGVWTLTTAGSTSDVNVCAGTLQLYNSPYSLSSNPFSDGRVTVKDGGTLTGMGCAGDVTVNRGGTVMAGYRGSYGTLKATGTVTLEEGSRLVVKVGFLSSSPYNDSYSFTGNVIHGGETIVIVLDDARVLETGEELTLFKNVASMTGTYTIRTEGGTQTITWDDSELLTRGVLRVASATASINGITSADGKADVYSVDGLLLRKDVALAEALDGLPAGVYVVNGRKVVKR
ncbi:MAG: cellulosome protein [Prevotella sp.]|nr:cellulosome protein [Prevotella sp.]